MSYDIWGNPLRRGYCEAHPHVQEEYPCSLCCAENDLKGREEDEWRNAMDDERRKYEEELIKQHQQELAFKEIGLPN